MHHSEDFEIRRGDTDITRREFLIAGTAAVALNGCVGPSEMKTVETNSQQSFVTKV